MENYKVRVRSDEESEQARGLFRRLGLTISGWSGFEYPCFVANVLDGEFSDYTCRDSGLACFTELTLPELHDLVVLKLNSKASQVEHDYKEISQEYKHYKKDVSNLNSIDVYRVLKLFDVKDPALQHAVKKILCAGDRGTKDKVQDIQEAIASLNRFLEMIKEDDDIPF
jgi:hypothetical protein